MALKIVHCQLGTNKLKLFWRTSIALFSSALSEKGFYFRQAHAKDMDFVTREVIKAGWHIGPYDFSSAYAFNPSGFIVGVLGERVILHSCLITYPNHHTHQGGGVVVEDCRGKGYGRAFYNKFEQLLQDQKYTVGGEMDHKGRSFYGPKGYRVFWNTYIAMLSLEKIVTKLGQASFPYHVAVFEPSNGTLLSSVLDYDSFIFGAPRHGFIKSWITAPGNFCLAALEESNIVGYSILRQVIRGGGTEIGLAMAPLYADSPLVAKALIKAAAEESLTNVAIPKTKLELFHPVGEGCGEGSPELMEELEAELTHIAFRMYNKGIPPGRKMKKIYGIASPTFD